ncbi:MAG: acetyltransferase [Hyphomonadaceae bacterium]|nr:acetyltransferase [Hyphomonadaceae bacterium]
MQTHIAPDVSVSLRPATPADLDRMLRWSAAPHLAAAGGDDDWAWPEEIHKTPDWREWLIAEAGSRPIGFIQIIDPLREETHYWGDCEPNLRAIDIWIGEPDMIGKGFGAHMMRQAIARCFAPPEVTAILIDPLATNTRAHRFYERLGFTFVEPRTFGDDACFVYRLNRKDWRP